MAKFNLKKAQQLLDEKYESVEVTDDDTEQRLFVLTAPLLLDREVRKELRDHLAGAEEAPKGESEDEAEARSFDFLKGIVRIAADDREAAVKWLEETVGDNLLYLSELVSFYFETAQPGEASPSGS